MRPSASSTMTLLHLGGLDGGADEARRIAVERHDVDLLAAQLLHDGLHARALHADARADRIDVGVAAGDGDLRACAGLAGAGDDLDDALVDLGHLGLEELLDEARIAARQDDLRAAGLAVDVLHVGDDAVAGAVGLARRLLAERQDALGAAEVDDEVVALLEAAHDALDELALAVLELVEDEVALLVADALDEHLLGGLRGDAAERLARLLDAQDVAELLVLLGGLLRVGRVPEDLEAELLAHLGLEPERCASSIAISRSSSATSSTTVMYWKRSTWPVSSLKRASSSRFGAEHALRGLEDRLLDRLDEARLVDPLVLRDHLDRLKEGQIAGGLLLLDCHVALSASSAEKFSSPTPRPRSGAMPAHRQRAMPVHRRSAMPSHRRSGTHRRRRPWRRTRRRGVRSRRPRAESRGYAEPSTTRTRPSTTPPSSPDDDAVASGAVGLEAALELGLVTREPHEVALGLQGSLDAGRADLELVCVRDEVDDVERGAQVARDVRAELEARRPRHASIAPGADAPAFSTNTRSTQPPRSGLELDVDHFGPVGEHDRLDARAGARRDRSRSVAGKSGRRDRGSAWRRRVKGQKKTRAPDWVPRA